MYMKHMMLWAMVGSALFAASARAQDTQATQAGVESGSASPSSLATNVPESAPDGANNITNQSNNPLTPKRKLILQNYFMPMPKGDGSRSADQELLRVYLPFRIFGVNNITRVYQTITTNPLSPTGRDAGSGDTTIYDLALHKINKFTVGTGPLLVLPVASHTNRGDGKWQVGAAAIAVTTRNWGLLGTVFTYQHSFSG
jgi:hypothetical protein